MSQHEQHQEYRVQYQVIEYRVQYQVMVTENRSAATRLSIGMNFGRRRE